MDSPSNTYAFAQFLQDLAKTRDALIDLIAAGAQWLRDNPEIVQRFKELGEAFRNYPEVQRVAMMKAADQGWYIAALASMRSFPPRADSDINQYYTDFMEKHWDELSADLVAKHPTRQAFLERAFERHMARDYISSVPLFLMLADGICEDLLAAHFFTDMAARDRILEGLKTEPDRFTAAMLDSLMLRNQMTERFSKPSAPPNSRAPNRAGILHGRKEYLDYPTKVNSLKCFSLVCLISLTLGEEGVLPPAQRAGSALPAPGTPDEPQAPSQTE